MPDLRPYPASRRVLFWGLALAGLAVDLAVKSWMFSRPDLLAGDVRWLWPGHAGLQLSLNEGALFGMGQGRVWVFAVAAGLAALALPAWLFLSGVARDAPLTATLGAVWGGIVGNLFDRLGLHGLDWGQFDPNRAGERVHAVRDYVLLAWRWDDDWTRRIVWPNFNVADSLLVCGAASLVLLSLRKPTPGDASAPADA